MYVADKLDQLYEAWPNSFSSTQRTKNNKRLVTKNDILATSNRLRMNIITNEELVQKIMIKANIIWKELNDWKKNGSETTK